MALIEIDDLPINSMGPALVDLSMAIAVSHNQMVPHFSTISPSGQ